MGGPRIDEVDEAGAAVELGEEEGGVGLGFRGRNPLKAGPNGTIGATTFAEDSTTVAA